MKFIYECFSKYLWLMKNFNFEYEVKDLDIVIQRLKF